MFRQAARQGAYGVVFIFHLSTPMSWYYAHFEGSYFWVSNAPKDRMVSSSFRPQ